MPVPDARYEFQIGGVWTDVTDDVRSAGNVTHHRGRPENASRVDPSHASLTVESPNGLYSNRNPRSPYFGLLGRNSLVRATVAGPTYLAISDPPGAAAATTPDHASLGITGDIDVRLDASLLPWVSPSSVVELAAKYLTSGDQRSWALYMLSSGQLNLRWSPDGTLTSALDVASDLPIPPPVGGRLAVRATLDVDNDASGHTVTFYTADSISGTWVQLGDPVTGAGTTSLFAGTAGVELGSIAGLIGLVPTGKLHGFELRDGIGGTVVANPDFTAQAVGASSFVDAAGRTWTIGAGSTLTDRWARFVLSVPEWPPSWHVSGHDVRATLQAAGTLRRLEQGEKPLDSALLRHIRVAGPIECWPLTDGAQAVRGASLFGGSPMVPNIEFGTAAVGWSEGSLADWIEPVALIPAQTDGTILGFVPENADAAAGWSVDLFRSGVGADESFTISDRGQRTDADPRISWDLQFTASANTVKLFGVSASETTASQTLLTTISSAGIYTEAGHHIRLKVTPGGSNSAWEVYIDGVSRASGTYAPISKAARSVRFGWFLAAATGDTPAIGYVTYWGPSAPDAAETYTALIGNQGETAADRVVRLAAENDVGMVLTGVAGESTLLGEQYVDTLLTLLGQCQDSDGGVLYEDRESDGLAYRTRTAHYNQPPALTIPYGQLAPPLTPVDDDQGPFPLRNDVTVTRIGGSWGRSVVKEGPLSTQAPPTGVGVYDESVSLSLTDDSLAVQHAGWRTHLGTWDEARYPSVRIYLHQHPQLIPAVLALDVGDVIRITDLPDFLPPGPIDLMVMGYREELGPLTWDLTLVCAPAGPWSQLGVVDDEATRADTTASELVTGVDADDTTLVVATTEGARWVDSPTYPSDFPIALQVGGEEVTATAVTGAVSDAFGRAVASGWGVADVGGTWTTAGGTATDFAVGSGIGTHTMTSTNISRRSSLTQPTADFDAIVDVATSALATGGSMFGGIMARVAGVNDLYYARIEFTTGAGIVLAIRERAAGVEATLGTAVTTPLTHVAGTFYRMRFQGTGSTLRAKVWLASASEPTGWHIEATDSTLTGAGTIGCRSILSSANTNVNPQIRYDTFALINPQAMTVTRSVNGIVKSHLAGTSVRLARPTYVAL